MSTTKKRVRGEDVELVCSKLETGATAMTNWTEFTAETSIGEDEASAASAKFEQFTPGKLKATGSVKGYAGSSEVQPDLPQPGDEIKTLAVQTITEGADLFDDLGDETKYGKIIVTKTRYSQTAKPGEWGFDWRSGGL